LIAALLLATAASATTVRKLNDSQMIAASDVVVVGQCIQMKSEWVGRNLMTRYTFKVDEVWSGAAKKTIHIVVPGGADANRKFPVATVYPGAPIFMPNERAVLLLDEMSGQFQGAYSVVGFNQGRFTIGRGEITAAKSSASTAEPQLQRRERDALTKLRARFGQLIAAKGAR
ncbi:MAG: hypothetical protein AAGK22_19190, partial [Acidobacteriota bacterium]